MRRGLSLFSTLAIRLFGFWLLENKKEGFSASHVILKYCFYKHKRTYDAVRSLQLAHNFVDILSDHYLSAIFFFFFVFFKMMFEIKTSLAQHGFFIIQVLLSCFWGVCRSLQKHLQVRHVSFICQNAQSHSYLVRGSGSLRIYFQYEIQQTHLTVCCSFLVLYLFCKSEV